MYDPVKMAPFSNWLVCPRCEGTGNELYKMYRECQRCGGEGWTDETMNPPVSCVDFKFPLEGDVDYE